MQEDFDIRNSRYFAKSANDHRESLDALEKHREVMYKKGAPFPLLYGISAGIVSVQDSLDYARKRISEYSAPWFEVTQ